METAIKLRMDGLTETHLDVENLIYDTVWRFKDRYGGDFDELLAQANYYYILAYDAHDGKRKFSTWVRFCIWKGLIDLTRFLREENKYVKVKSLETSNQKTEGFLSTQPLIDLLDEMGEDCCTITNLILDPPFEFPDTPSQVSSPRNFKASLKRYLCRNLNWTGRRIKETLVEMERIVNAN